MSDTVKIGQIAMQFMTDLQLEEQKRGSELEIDELVITVRMRDEDGHNAVGYRHLTNDHMSLKHLLVQTLDMEIDHLAADAIMKGAQLHSEGVHFDGIDDAEE